MLRLSILMEVTMQFTRRYFAFLFARWEKKLCWWKLQ